MITDWVSDLAGSVAGDTVEKLILFMAGWLVEIFTTMLDLVGTWWLNIGAPEMGPGTASERVQTATTTFVAVAGIIGTAFASLHIARDHNRESAENLVMGLIRTVVVSALAVSMVALSLAVTDEAAPWLVDTIAGNAARDGLGQSMGLGTMAAAQMALPTAGMLILLAPFAMLGAFLNAALVIFSYGVAGALCGLLPIFAAASTTERGRKSFDKALGWLIAMILFKPGAAVIYGFGLALMNGIDGTAGDDVSNKIISLITGIVIIFSACLTMPALVRVLVPAVSAGPRGMGAGGLAMLAGGVAIGALTAGVGTAAAGAATAGASATGAGAGAGGAGSGATGALSSSGTGGGALSSGGTGGGGGFSEAGASGDSSAQNGTGAQSSGAGGGAGGDSPSTGGPTGAQNAEPTSAGAAPTSSAGNTSGGASGAENVESATAGAASTSAPGTTTGGASGAENVQSPSTGVAPNSAAGTGTGGASGAESVQSSSPSPAAAGGASEASGPAGAEPVAATTGAGASGHPDGEGSSVTGARKPLIDGHRLEYGIREVVRDGEQSIESGEDL